MLIIDFHTHLGRSKDGAEQKLTDMLHGMRRFKVNRSVVFPIDEKDPGPSYARLNRRIANCTKQFKNLIGCARLNPNEPAAAFQEIARARSSGFRAVKLHPRSDAFSMDTAKPLFPEISKNGFAVVLHTDHEIRCHPQEWTRIFKAYPKISFVLAHSGKDLFREAIEVANECPNVYLDTSTLSYYRTGMILKQAGAKKVVFASDIPYSHLGLEIKKFEFLIPRSKQKLVFGENAKRILKL